MCVFYKANWLVELNKTDSIRTWSKRDRRKYSRYIYASGQIFTSSPPFCRFGYICKACYEINDRWYNSMKDDVYFRDYAQKYLDNMRALQPEKHALQLKLF